VGEGEQNKNKKIVIYEILMAVKMTVLFFWVVMHTDLQVDIF
jgi:hypothetical protein